MQNRKGHLMTVAALLAGVLLAALVLAQRAGAAIPPAQEVDSLRTVTVLGQGAVRMAPDVAEVVVGAEFVAPTPAGAAEQVDLVMEKVTAALVDLPLSEADIQRSSVALAPRPACRCDGNSDLSADIFYTASGRAHVVIQNVSQTEAVLRAAIKAGANKIDSVKFGVKDPAAAEAEARQKALSQAQDRADALAVLTGLQVGRVYQIKETVSSSSLTPSGEESETTFPHQVETTVQVQITYTLE